MSKPEDIPQDVWDRARDALSDSTGLHPDNLDQDYLDCMANHMHRAILAERERCAKVAENELRNTAMLMSNPPKSSAAWDIRNAILSGDPA